MTMEQEPNDRNHNIRNFVLGGMAVGALVEGLIIGEGVLIDGTKILEPVKDSMLALGGTAFGGAVGGTLGYFKDKMESLRNQS